jgi:regulation of enolase protein 1 (concanavalin A-like superfamily)
LVRPAPETVPGELEITVTMENHPTQQYEQVNLSWYYDDRHMVKLGQELVDGKLCIVMGREEADRPRTVNILPLTSDRVKLRYLVGVDRLRSQCQPEGSNTWQEVGGM